MMKGMTVLAETLIQIVVPNSVGISYRLQKLQLNIQLVIECGFYWRIDNLSAIPRLLVEIVTFCIRLEAKHL